MDDAELIPALVDGTVIPVRLSEAMVRVAGLPSPVRVGWFPGADTMNGYSPSKIPFDFHVWYD